MEQEKQTSSVSTKERVERTLQLGRTLRVVWESAPGWTLANAALVIVQSLMPLAILYLLKLIIDAVTAGAAVTDRAGACRHVVLLVSLAGGAILVTVLCRSLADLVKEAQSRVVTDYVSDLIHAKSVEVDLAYLRIPPITTRCFGPRRKRPGGRRASSLI
jgi:ATP-binding cassette subfamily B protein